MKALIIIPAFNEEKALPDVIKELRKNGFNDTLVVDDGSHDNTLHIAKENSKYVLHHFLNRGKGAAVKTGMEAAKRLGPDVIVTFDADGQHNPADISKMLVKIDEGYDVVLGFRNYFKDRVPFIRVIGNYLGNFFTWVLYGVWTKDSQCGLKAFSKKAYFAVDTKTDKYEYDSEIVREMKKNHLRYVHVPIKVRYTAYSRNKSDKMNFTNGLKMIGRMFLSS